MPWPASPAPPSPTGLESARFGFGVGAGVQRIGRVGQAAVGQGGCAGTWRPQRSTGICSAFPAAISLQQPLPQHAAVPHCHCVAASTRTLAEVTQVTQAAGPSDVRTRPHRANMGLHTAAVSSVPTITILRGWVEGRRGSRALLDCSFNATGHVCHPAATCTQPRVPPLHTNTRKRIPGWRKNVSQAAADDTTGACRKLQQCMQVAHLQVRMGGWVGGGWGGWCKSVRGQCLLAATLLFAAALGSPAPAPAAAPNYHRAKHAPARQTCRAHPPWCCSCAAPHSYLHARLAEDGWRSGQQRVMSLEIAGSTSAHGNAAPLRATFVTPTHSHSGR